MPANTLTFSIKLCRKLLEQFSSHDAFGSAQTGGKREGGGLGEAVGRQPVVITRLTVHRAALVDARHTYTQIVRHVYTYINEYRCYIHEHIAYAHVFKYGIYATSG